MAVIGVRNVGKQHVAGIVDNPRARLSSQLPTWG